MKKQFRWIISCKVKVSETPTGMCFTIKVFLKIKKLFKNACESQELY